MANPQPVSDTSLQIVRTVDTDPQTVFDAWTQPELIKKWFAPGDHTVPAAEVDLCVGGRYRITMQQPDGHQDISSGAYKEIVPGQRLVMTWAWEVPDAKQTLLTVEFRAVAGGTEITLTHEDFRDAEQRDLHDEGWHGCLDNLPKVFI